MELITITRENLEREHICCAISDNRDCQVMAKKAWLAQSLDDGLVFTKGNVRGKCFIEYIPAQKAWAPIDAPGYAYIDCLWVSGQFKGQGYSTMLMDSCENDCRKKGMKGLVALSSTKKKAFLSDPAYMRHRGFQIADTAQPDFELLYLPFDASAPRPAFRASVRDISVPKEGFALYYTHQCPFTAKYVPIIEGMAREAGVPFEAIRFETAQQAQNAPAPWTTYSLFYNGRFVTHEIQSERKFEKLLANAAK